MGMTAATSRRGFLKSAGVFVLATYLPFDPAPAQVEHGPPPAAPQPNTFISIADDGTVTVQIKHLEMGQGVATGLCTIVAEELDADWAQMRFAFAPANGKLYNNLFFGPLQGTGESNSTSNSWMQLRRAAAAMRAMLVAAASAAWGTAPEAIEVRGGRIVDRAGGRSVGFGEVAVAAARLPVPEQPVLKDVRAFTLIGRQDLRRLDVADKTNGKAVYTLDMRQPGQLFATVQRSPRFGGKLASFDAEAARKVRGVIDVLAVPMGIAVIASNSWAAIKGQKAISAQWDFSAAENRSTDQIMTDFKAAAATATLKAAERGDVAAGFADATKTIEFEFEFPYLAHAPLEPLATVIQRRAGGEIELWTASQSQSLDQYAVAGIMGVPPARVIINTLLAGGSFGRRSDPLSDYVVEAAEVLKAYGGDKPILVFRTRENDFEAGLFRPMSYHKARVGIGAAGEITAWDHVVVSKSITKGTAYAPHTIHDGLDVTTVSGLIDHPYTAPNFRTLAHQSDEQVTVTWWRSVAHSHTAHVVEVMIDALAHLAKVDPVAYRTRLIEKDPRLVATMKLAAEKSDWGRPLGKGRGRGIAVHASHRSMFAVVAEVKVERGLVKVERIVVAVDCGIPINPDNIRAQFEGGTGFMLSAVLRNRITLKDGEIEQRNFDAYEPTRIHEMPEVEVHVMQSTAAPGGIGEPGVICVGPAIVNAIHDATGEWRTRLPLKAELEQRDSDIVPGVVLTHQGRQ